MQCPSCRSAPLRPIKLQPGLPARQCVSCHGILIDLLAYREWAESHQYEEPTASQPLEEVEDIAKALVCPKCTRIMLKFRIAEATANKVDVCTNCDEAWLDKGEWELLGALRLQHKLNAIFTEPWQRNIRKESAENANEQRFKAILGDEQFEKLSEIKIWLDNHPNKHDLIRFLLKQ